jgi:glycosyltransferase involved in cell wall biosynthesis
MTCSGSLDPRDPGVARPDGRLSVVMPVYNAAPFLDEAIASIVQQTFRDFEFIIADDASTDRSREIACAWAARDERIRLVRATGGHGLSPSSNFAVGQARAPIVARMDADDIALPERFARQLHVLETRADVVLVGAMAEGIDEAGRRVRPRDRWRIVRTSPYIPFPHGSIMFRRDAFEAIGGYRMAAQGVEDQDLVHRLRRAGRIVTLPDLLYRYRYHAENSSAHLDAVPDVDWDRSARSTQRAARCYTRGAIRLWAGAPPGVIRDLTRRGVRAWHPRYAAIMIWALWGEASPATLRACLRALATVRDGICGYWIRDGVACEWRSGRC